MTFWTAGAIAASAVVGGIAANNAADAQVAGIRAGQRSQERMFNKQVELQEPFRQAGVEGKNRLMELLGLGDNTGSADFGRDSQPFSMANFQADPGYAFRLSEGLKALDRSAAARGGLLSGNQLRGVTELGQNMGSQEYQNAFNRFYSERASRLNPLQSLMGVGQTSTNAMSNAAADFGKSQADAAAAIGNARASGYMGMANAVSSGLGQYMNYSQGQNMLAAFRPRPSQSYVYNSIQEM